MDTAILIAGPTASGKSRLAIDLARTLNGVIINADSMQVYRELRVLTARPDGAEEAAAPHRLYGITSAAAPFSVGRWLELALAEAAAARDAGQVPIFVGGTGLYFQALTQGMAEIPDITEPARAEARGMLDELGAAGLHAALGERDPVMAQRLKPTDSQRLVRAYEVIESTGVSLADWQQRPSSTPTLPLPWRGFVLDEVAKLAAMNLDPALPAMKALGVPELIRLSRGEISREAALSAAQQATRRYAKRQMTWFRNKMCAWNGLDAQDSERLSEIIIPFIT